MMDTFALVVSVMQPNLFYVILSQLLLNPFVGQFRDTMMQKKLTSNLTASRL